MLGRNFLSLFREDEGADARLGLASAFNGAKAAEQISHWCTRDGGERVVAWTATPIVDGEGRSLALIVGVDATERQRREAELRSSEERLRAAIQASPVAIVEYALDDTITRWNPAAERIFGWTAEQVIGGKARHQPPGREAELAELFRRVRAGEVYSGVESKRVRSDGAYIDVVIAAAPIRDTDGQVVSHMALFADISERKRQDEEIRASRARIVEAGDEARRQLERNLHDGAQQRLVALSLSLRLAQSKVSTDPAGADTVLESARVELAAALDELRELARGIHPAVLTDRGLEAARRGPRDALAHPRRVRDAGGGAAAPGRGRGLLRDRRSARERDQVRAGHRGQRARRARGRPGDRDGLGRWRRRRRSGRRLGPARPRRPRRGARRQPHGRQPGPGWHPHDRRDPTASRGTGLWERSDPLGVRARTRAFARALAHSYGLPHL